MSEKDWCIIEQAEDLESCPFCGDSPVFIAAPLRFGIQCNNPECFAMVYTDYTPQKFVGEKERPNRTRGLTEAELMEIVKSTVKKWNRRQ